MNLVVANLKARVVKTLDGFGPLTFSNLSTKLRNRDEKRLDNALQSLRTTGQIHFIKPINGWDTGRGRKYMPNVR